MSPKSQPHFYVCVIMMEILQATPGPLPILTWLRPYLVQFLQVKIQSQLSCHVQSSLPFDSPFLGKL